MNAMVETNIYGHLSVYGYEKEHNKNRTIIRDRDEMVAFIKENITDVKEVRDEITGDAYAIGNGQGSLLILMGAAHKPEDLEKEYILRSGDFSDYYNKKIENPMILEYHMADTLKVKVGEVVKVRLNNVYGQIQTARLNVVAIVEMNNPILEAFFQGALPMESLKKIMGYGPNETGTLNVVLDNIDNLAEVVPYADELHNKLAVSGVHSFRLAERTYTETDLAKKRRRIRRESFSGAVVDIVSLLELRESDVQMESAMGIIGFVATLIILSIILVGVLNTVRMNIRERIREIGTVRAVGMQKKMVVRTLVMEVGLLALFSSLLGILASFGLMDLVSLITFPTKDLTVAVILSDGHILFKPPVKVILITIFTIISLVMLAAWFPARKAAKKPVSEALGHYE
jgi:putative ABC transport system permease protein